MVVVVVAAAALMQQMVAPDERPGTEGNTLESLVLVAVALRMLVDCIRSILGVEHMASFLDHYKVQQDEVTSDCPYVALRDDPERSSPAHPGQPRGRMVVHNHMVLDPHREPFDYLEDTDHQHYNGCNPVLT